MVVVGGTRYGAISGRSDTLGERVGIVEGRAS